jgi:hypothetical protein
LVDSFEKGVDFGSLCIARKMIRPTELRTSGEAAQNARFLRMTGNGRQSKSADDDIIN